MKLLDVRGVLDDGDLMFAKEAMLEALRCMQQDGNRSAYTEIVPVGIAVSVRRL